MSIKYIPVILITIFPKNKNNEAKIELKFL